MSDLPGRLKDLASVFAGAGAVLYAFGYLVVRSRSFVLGTDPDFALIDQAYIFAGAKFIAIALIALLIVSPFVAGLLYSMRCLGRVLSSSVSRLLQVVAALVLACTTVTLMWVCLSSGGLFACGNATKYQWVRDAVLGADYNGFFVVLLGAGVTALSVIWLWGYGTSARFGSLVWLVLVPTFVLQTLLLPLLIGALFPNQRARELVRVPDTLNYLALPLWAIDRGADRTVLLTRASHNRFALVTVKNEVLDGTPTTSSSLSEILRDGEFTCSAAASPGSE